MFLVWDCLCYLVEVILSVCPPSVIWMYLCVGKKLTKLCDKEVLPITNNASKECAMSLRNTSFHQSFSTLPSITRVLGVCKPVEGLCLDSTLLFLASELFIYALCCHLVSILSAYAVEQWRFMLYVAELDFFIQYQYPVWGERCKQPEQSCWR